MSVVRIEALKALGAVIEAAVPALVGRVKIGQQPAGVEQIYPTLTLELGTLKYQPFDEYEHATIGDPSDGNVVFNVGEWGGPLLMRLVATTVGERYELEDKITNVFLAQELRRGVRVVQVTANPELSNWLAAFELESTQWVDSEAFDRKLGSLLVMNAQLPALVTRAGVYEIDELVLGITSDFTTAFTTATMVPPGVELVQINEDGTIEPWSPPP